eukprot:scaffold8641_cov134-Isochrysis_galbana.AAC.2
MDKGKSDTGERAQERRRERCAQYITKVLSSPRRVAKAPVEPPLLVFSARRHDEAHSRLAAQRGLRAMLCPHLASGRVAPRLRIPRIGSGRRAPPGAGFGEPAGGNDRRAVRMAPRANLGCRLRPQLERIAPGRATHEADIHARHDHVVGAVVRRKGRPVGSARLTAGGRRCRSRAACKLRGGGGGRVSSGLFVQHGLASTEEDADLVQHRWRHCMARHGGGVVPVPRDVQRVGREQLCQRGLRGQLGSLAETAEGLSEGACEREQGPEEKGPASPHLEQLDDALVVPDLAHLEAERAADALGAGLEHQPLTCSWRGAARSERSMQSDRDAGPPVLVDAD